MGSTRSIDQSDVENTEIYFDEWARHPIKVPNILYKWENIQLLSMFSVKCWKFYQKFEWVLQLLFAGSIFFWLT